MKRPANPEFKPDEQRGYRFNCWLPNDATGFLHPEGRTKGWTTENWDIINYYLAKGIGLGFKALSVPKAEHIWVFDEASVNAVIEEVKRRWVTLRLEK